MRVRLKRKCKCGCNILTKLHYRKKKYNNYIIGHHNRNEEKRKNASNALKGRKRSRKIIDKIMKTKSSCVYVCSKETKKKMSRAHKGKKLSEECKRKIGLIHKGKILSITQKRLISKRNKGSKRTKETKRKMSLSAMARLPDSEETRRKKGLVHKGKKFSDSRKKAMSLARKGSNCYNWQGGKSFEPYGVEFNNDLKELIRKRDNYKCRICNKKQTNRRHVVHHIDYNKINSDPKNLITLCISCHMKTNYNKNEWKKLLLKINEKTLFFIKRNKVA